MQRDRVKKLPGGPNLTRREVLGLIGAAAVVALVGCGNEGSSGAGGTTNAPTLVASPIPTQAPSAANTGTLPTCIVRPEQTEGPYFVDEKLNRADIRSDPSEGTIKEGVPLSLVFHVSQISSNGCTPLVGAQVDVWQCDALGVYSDVQDPGFNTVGKKFLRGYHQTDASGTARFLTIYPGWYQGRTVHIHFKIRTDPGSKLGYEFTSQLYFDDSITDQVHAQAPYAGKGQRTLKNNGDGIFRNGGNQLMLQPIKDGDGYTATFGIGLQMS